MEDANFFNITYRVFLAVHAAQCVQISQTEGRTEGQTEGRTTLS